VIDEMLNDTRKGLNTLSSSMFRLLK